MKNKPNTASYIVLALVFLLISCDAISSGKKGSNLVYQGAGHNFTLEKMYEIEGDLWSMAFLPGGSVIATQKTGGLWLLQKGKSNQKILNAPTAMTKGQGGFFDIKLDPDYTNNKFIYVAYSEASDRGAMTKVDRGHLDGVKWVHSKTLFSSRKQYHVNTHHHFGGRIVLGKDSIYFTVGDRGQRPHAQDLSLPNGKIHRLTKSGETPKDNPFINKTKHYNSIWSFGHRNPQGMAVHPVTGDIWAAEHGPKGGDEINLIGKGKNYGWPVITYGKNYSGTSMTDITQKEGMEQPKHYWVPSIAVSGIEFYTGEHFPKWKNQLLVTSLAKQELHLLKIDNNDVVSDTVLLKGLGRMRHVADAPDGYPYIAVLQKNGKATGIYRIKPNTK